MNYQRKLKNYIYMVFLLSCCVCVCMLRYSVTSDSLQTDCSPPGSSVHGIFQERILEWVVTSSSIESSQSMSLSSPALTGGFLTTEPRS